MIIKFFYQIISTMSLRRCVDISLVNLSGYCSLVASNVTLLHPLTRGRHRGGGGDVWYFRLWILGLKRLKSIQLTVFYLWYLLGITRTKRCYWSQRISWTKSIFSFALFSLAQVARFVFYVTKQLHGGSEVACSCFWFLNLVPIPLNSTLTKLLVFNWPSGFCWI